jgi:hypothetical protein
MVDDVEVDSRDDFESGRVEWLDLGPPERPAGVKSASPVGPRGRWYALAVVVIAAAVLVAANHSHEAKRATATPSHSQPSAALPSALETSTAAPSGRQVAVTNIGHRLLDVPPDWELFGAGPGVLVRIELARGRVTRTVVPPLNTGGEVSVVAGPDRVIIRPYDKVPGYQVRDGRAPEVLPGALGVQGPALPGPDPDHVWVPTSAGQQSVMTLVGLDGGAGGVPILIPDDFGSVSSDGAGYVVFYATGGVYDARPGGIHRITTGGLLATGPTSWLTYECDDQYRCASTVTNRATGARHVLNTPGDAYGDGGVIAPDGSTAAVLAVDSAGTGTVHLLDLVSGADRSTGITLDPKHSFGAGSLVWSPDSRWLFVPGANGSVIVLDRRTMNTSGLGVRLPPVSELVLRTGSG